MKKDLHQNKAGQQEARQQPQRGEDRREDYPGYPHYDEANDMMNQNADTHRVRLDVEKLTPSGQVDGKITGGPMAHPRDEQDQPEQTGKPGKQMPMPVERSNDDFDVDDEAYERVNLDEALEQQEEKARHTPETAGREDEESNVSDEERGLLDRAGNNSDDSDDVTAPLRAELDETDEDGDPLNEAAGNEAAPGEDIDVPGSERDDENENIGEEDEENNYYSLGSDDNDNLEGDQG